MSHNTPSQPPAPNNTSTQQGSDATETLGTSNVESTHAKNNELIERLSQQLVKEALSQGDGLFDTLDVERESPRNPMSPREGLEKYLEDAMRTCSQGTHDSKASRLDFFVRWCEQPDETGTPRIESLDQLTGSHLMEFRDWRRETAESWKVITEKTQMKTLRQFLEYCEKPEWVSENLSKKVQVPKINPEDESRDTMVRQHEVDALLDHFQKFKYASFEHVVWLILGRTGCRTCGLLALDKTDYVPDDETGTAILKFRNREETGTRLKNGSRSERNFEVGEDVREVLDDYIAHNREDVVDEYGREPLITTTNGRPAKSTIRKYVYMWSRPCEVSGECPYNRDITECEAAQSNDRASKCPDSVSAHPIRRGRLTWALNQGLLPEMISGMYDVSPEILKKHYDERTHEEKQRLESHWDRMLRSGVVDAFGRIGDI